MSEYRKKPVKIEAWPVAELLHAAEHDWKVLPNTVAAAYERGDILFARDGISIATREGRMRGDKSDWLIEGVQGEFYPCKPDIFDATYEPA